MAEGKDKEIGQFMTEEYARFAPMLDRYNWPWETASWHELVFCLMASIDDSGKTEAIARETTQILADLDLLEIDDLVNLLPDEGDCRGRADR